MELPPDDVEPAIEEEQEEIDENVDAKPQDHAGRVPPIVEPGLSVAPEDLARQWLGTATEQANFESSAIEPDEELGIHITKLPFHE